MEAKIKGEWVPAKLTRHVYHFQFTKGGPFEFPLKVRLTSNTGEVVEDSIPEISDEVQVGGSKTQFKGSTANDDEVADRSTCTAPKKDCRETKCCQVKGQKCFVKHKHWAGCRHRCEEGKPDPSDPHEHRKPWSCEVLEKRL